MDLSSILGNLGMGGQSTQQSQAQQQGIRAYQLYKQEQEALSLLVLSPQDYLKSLQTKQAPQAAMPGGLLGG